MNNIKIDIFSGFLGAGKTTLIKKLIKEGYNGEKLVLIENEFGDIGIDGAFMQDAGITVNEINSGCICCSLVGDFSKALAEVVTTYAPERIIIEPSGVGKLSDVIKAVEDAKLEGAVINSATVVVDASKCKLYMKNFGEFFNNQVENAKCIVLSHTKGIKEEKLHKAIELIREKNAHAEIVTTDWDLLPGKEIIKAMENTDSLVEELERLVREFNLHELEHERGEECSCGCGGHHHHDHEHHHEHGEECHCHDHEHHHEHGEECHCHDHEHHHEHGEECHCHDHEHHHEHGEECHCHDHEHHHEHGEECHCHDHEHHHEHGEECHCHDHEHHHHADEIFENWGVTTAKKFSKEELAAILMDIENEHEFGTVLRAKGVVEGENGAWIHFDYVPGEPDIREGSATVTGRLCVIGADLNKKALAELFGV